MGKEAVLEWISIFIQTVGPFNSFSCHSHPVWNESLLVPVLQWFNLLLLHISVYTGQVTLAMSMDVTVREFAHSQDDVENLSLSDNKYCCFHWHQ